MAHHPSPLQSTPSHFPFTLTPSGYFDFVLPGSSVSIPTSEGARQDHPAPLIRCARCPVTPPPAYPSVSVALLAQHFQTAQLCLLRRCHLRDRGSSWVGPTSAGAICGPSLTACMRGARRATTTAPSNVPGRARAVQPLSPFAPARHLAPPVARRLPWPTTNAAGGRLRALDRVRHPSSEASPALRRLHVHHDLPPRRTHHRAILGRAVGWMGIEWRRRAPTGWPRAPRLPPRPRRSLRPRRRVAFRRRSPLHPPSGEGPSARRRQLEPRLVPCSPPLPPPHPARRRARRLSLPRRARGCSSAR